jgi:hypothetical protein
MNKELAEFKKKVREALANYMYSEGCSCCQRSDHEIHATELGKLLHMRKFPDKSGYDFSQYRSKHDER